MTVPCGGTGVSEEKRTQSVKSGEYESSDFGAFLLSVASKRPTTEVQMNDSEKYDVQTASILIDTAKAELDRKIASELPEQTKRLAFYQGFCVVVLGVLFYLFDNPFLPRLEVVAGSCFRCFRVCVLADVDYLFKRRCLSFRNLQGLPEMAEHSLPR